MNMNISVSYTLLVCIVSVMGYVILGKYFNTETPSKEDSQYHMNVKFI